MSRSSLVLVGACCLAIACKSEQQATKTASASAKASASATKGDVSAPPEAKHVAARQYLPSGCDVALEVDIQKLFEEPVIGPQLLTGLVPPTDPQLRAQVMADPEQASFLGFLEAAKIAPRRDLETVAVCLPEGESGSDARYLAIIAGQFPGGLVETFRDHAPPGKAYSVESLGTKQALFREGKWASQGVGNVVLFGNDKELILAAQSPSKAYESYGLGSASDITVTLGEHYLASVDGPANDPMVALLRRGKRVRLDVNLRDGDLKGAVTLPDAKAVDQFQSAIETLRSQMKRQSQQAPAQLRQMMQPSIDLLERTQFTKDGKQLGFAVKLPVGLLEGMMQQAAMALFNGAPASAAPPNMMATMAPGQPGRRALSPPARRSSRAQRRSRQVQASRPPAPVAPLPPMPNFQLTPPSVLQGKGVVTPPVGGAAPKGG